MCAARQPDVARAFLVRLKLSLESKMPLSQMSCFMNHGHEVQNPEGTVTYEIDHDRLNSDSNRLYISTTGWTGQVSGCENGKNDEA
jgi:hypothetical protein